jgi:hypothetical protein
VSPQALHRGGTGKSPRRLDQAVPAAPARFQEVRAERGVAKLGVGFAFAANQGVALNFARAVNGRNTVNDDQVIGVSYTLGF